MAGCRPRPSGHPCMAMNAAAHRVRRRAPCAAAPWRRSSVSAQALTQSRARGSPVTCCVCHADQQHQRGQHTGAHPWGRPALLWLMCARWYQRPVHVSVHGDVSPVPSMAALRGHRVTRCLPQRGDCDWCGILQAGRRCVRLSRRAGGSALPRPRLTPRAPRPIAHASLGAPAGAVVAR